MMFNKYILGGCAAVILVTGVTAYIFYKQNLKLRDENQLNKVQIQNYSSQITDLKESFSKALGTGFRETLNFKDISITNNKHGKPSIKINNKLHNLINKKFKTKKIKVLLSISDESEHSIAFVILEIK